MLFIQVLLQFKWQDGMGEGAEGHVVHILPTIGQMATPQNIAALSYRIRQANTFWVYAKYCTLRQ